MFDEIDKPKNILQLSHINFFAKNSEDWAEPAPTSPLNINQQFIDSSSLGDEFEVVANVSGSRGYGTRFVWNSVMSTLRAPSKRSDAVRDEITCARREVKLGVGRPLGVKIEPTEIIEGPVLFKAHRLK